jgi:cardiolipin synthase
MNLVDPRYFKRDAGVGEWVDAMVRVEGAAVGMLAATFVGDWQLETQEPLADIVRDAGLKIRSSRGSAEVQVFSSGPGETEDGLLQMIIETINSSDTELTLTTPYLVPDDALLRAIRLAACRGVNVRLIVPEKVDSLFTRYASRSYFDDLLDAGVEIYLYRDGLLHTKSILSDRSIAMFGTANLDMRSLWLNYEVALFVYDVEFAQQLHQLQESYLADSKRLDLATWNQRPYIARFAENVMRLMSPLL